MSQWFTSDLHLGHKKIVEFRGFSSPEAMSQKVYEMFDVVKKGDFVYILGDVARSQKEAVDFFKFLIMEKKVADIYVIEGNHDKNWMKGLKFSHPKLHICQTMTLNPQKVEGCQNTIFLSHYPQLIYNESHYGSYQLHGHGHFSTSDRPLLDNMVLGKRLNVNCDLHDFKLWSRQDVEEFMQSRPQNIDWYLCKGNEKQKEIAKKFLAKENIVLNELFKKLKEAGG